MKFTVIGGGLAGVEAAWQIAGHGYAVTLIEQKPLKFSPAHKQEGLAELVCSNSLKAERINSAAGLLKKEMQRFGSLCVATALECKVPAGGALAVDRAQFSQKVTEKVERHPLITIKHSEATVLEAGSEHTVIVATGPLTEGTLGEEIQRRTGNYLNFYDAAAPIVTADSIDQSVVFGASRYDRGGAADYLNCPFNKAEYEAFHEALIHAESAPLHSFDKAPTVYEGCMPIEIMAKRGKDTIRYGPMKPVGLVDPRTGHRPWAAVQLRRENADGTMFNLVGFQTNLKFGEQKRVFSMIPGLAGAEFVRFGVMHRNSFINSPKVLGSDYSFRENPHLFFAGQLTGVEGYMESAAAGILAGLNAVRRFEGKKAVVLPRTTMMGALTRYISDESVTHFQPMGANFGVLPAIEPHIRDKQARYQALADRGLADLERLLREEIEK